MLPLPQMLAVVALLSALASGAGVWWLQGLRSDSHIASVNADLAQCRAGVALQNQALAGFASAAKFADARAADLIKQQAATRRALSAARDLVPQIQEAATCSEALQKAWQ